MPTSAIEGKKWTLHTLLRLSEHIEFQRILDVGPGRGTYSLLFRRFWPKSTWHAVEIWEAYQARFGLDQLYDEVVISDIRHYSTTSPKYDLIFLGDILEHMAQEEALTVVEQLLRSSPLLLISLPIVKMPQEESEGNPYERHVKDDWSHAEVMKCWGSYVALAHLEGPIGVYLCSAQQGITEVVRLLCAS